jgi:hypothetical protein
LMHSSRLSGSKPPHDNTAEREQNPHYGHYNGLETLPVSATAIGPEKVTPANHDLGILIRGLASHTEDDDEPCANYFPAEQFPDDVNVRTPPGAKFHIPTGIGEGVYEPFVVRAKPHIDGNEFEFEIKSIVVIAYI